MYCATLYLFFIEMMAGQIGRIGWKSIEITLYACPVELGIISMDFHQIQSGGRIQPGICTGICPVELGRFIEITLYACLVESVEFGGHNLSGFPPNLTS